MNSGKFLETVRKTIQSYGMDPSSPLALVSGGPDSVALLRVLVQLNSPPSVLHLEHGVRGQESLEDAEFVQNLCEKLGLKFEMRRLELDKGPNFQERAREARYRAAEKVAKELGAESIVTGHTADDVAETVLMNLARGTGLRGLTGIPPVRHTVWGSIFRPLIRTSREEILDYLKLLEQPYRLDPSNLTGDYSRNRVRREILPILEDLYPGAKNNISRGASIFYEDLQALEEIAAKHVYERNEEIIVPLDELKSLPTAIQRHALRRAYSLLLSDASGLSLAHTEAVLRLLESGEGTRTINLPEGIIAAARTSGELAFYPEPIEEKSVPLPGGVSSEESFLFGGWEVEVQRDVVFDGKDARRPEVAYLDEEKGPYTLRMAREGDTIRPLGLGGSKKVLRAMMDRGVPKDVRRKTPVILDESGDVAWIFCGELGERYGVYEETKKVLRLEVKERREHG